MNEASPAPRADAPVVVFDFDHTLYDGDSFSHALRWMLKRNPLRAAGSIVASLVLGPMVAWLPTRRHGISGYVWIATLGLHRRRGFDALLDRYVIEHEGEIRARLLPRALEVFGGHRANGDEVVVATGAPPELARAILAFVAHQDVPVIGTAVGPRFGAMMATRHCHHAEKLRMLRERGYGDIAAAYSDSTADLPLLQAARKPVVVNPGIKRVELFRRLLPPGTPILNWGCAKRGGEGNPLSSDVGAT
ncbi:haloacid dehalogenase-like hydrolase [Pseudoxanthomonas helianthi]|uniref:Haloacid dehalogenase-like hydrolase n=1 Tax=Pseudoxanthomonas helianthi TaxID=1453541 RepID=A0A940WXX5_9GAMM|nr:haloacid dehalogenase-like hydrolase [Pseudoxanthomonas helianthi]MBP3983169.1 haloacid dehalogenase-like hydrolase [Pseudoxanthomonas helianthi]